MGFFRNAMNSYYYGKSGKGDYTPENLPKTRFALFREMLQIRLSGLVRLNLMYAICWLPAMIVLMIGVMNLYTVLAAEEEMAGLQTLLLQNISSTLLLLFPCIAITGPFTAGISFVTRNWARDEHAFIWSDFIDAVKANWKQALPVSVLTGLIPVLSWTCFQFYGELSNRPGMGIMAAVQVLVLMLTLLSSLAILFVYPQIVTYEMKLGGILRNSLLLALSKLPMALGIRLLHMLPMIIGAMCFLFLNPIWSIFGVFVYYLIFGFALSRFITASFTNAVFDQHINSRIAGAEVNRGLAVQDDDEDEEDEEDKDEA